MYNYTTTQFAASKAFADRGLFEPVYQTNNRCVQNLNIRLTKNLKAAS
jgi:hypothetical protein